MFQFLFGLFIILHGLVHLWYFTLSQKLVEFKPEMGWSGKSWLFTGVLGDPGTRWLASTLFVVAAIALVISGLGITIRADWWRQMLAGSTIFSCAIIILFWDGNMELLVQKGLIGFLISLVTLLTLLLKQPPAAI